MRIRPYKEKDRDDVRYICLNCDGPSDMSPEGEHFILTAYCDYYIEREKENCFVAADEDDKAVGYILCAENFESFIHCFREEYIPRIPEDQTDHIGYAKASTAVQEKYKNEYPAHLHIDIMPEYQRMGLGHKLMDTLLSHLKDKGIKGIVLSVADFNDKGIAFYKKYGFTLAESSSDGIAFVKKLN